MVRVRNDSVPFGGSFFTHPNRASTIYNNIIILQTPLSPLLSQWVLGWPLQTCSSGRRVEAAWTTAIALIGGGEQIKLSSHCIHWPEGSQPGGLARRRARLEPVGSRAQTTVRVLSGALCSRGRDVSDSLLGPPARRLAARGSLGSLGRQLAGQAGLGAPAPLWAGARKCLVDEPVACWPTISWSSFRPTKSASSSADSISAGHSCPPASCASLLFWPILVRRFLRLHLAREAERGNWELKYLSARSCSCGPNEVESAGLIGEHWWLPGAT